MEAACRGAKSAGGPTIGILPGDNPLSGNDYIDIPIITGMGLCTKSPLSLRRACL